MLSLVSLTFISLLYTLFSPPSMETKTFTGRARDVETGQFIYTENHEDIYEGKKLVKSITRYRLPNGSQTAERVLTFPDDIIRPDFVLKDSRIGYQEGVAKVGKNTVRVFYKDNFNSKLQEKILRLEEPYVVDAGLSHFFRRNWKALMDGQIVTFNFVAPAKLDYFRFRVSKAGIVRISGRQGMKLKLETNNFILRAILDPIYITYSLEDRSILHYEGVSNLVSEDGTNYNVIIEYPR